MTPWCRLAMVLAVTPAHASPPRRLPYGRAAAVAGGAYSLYSWAVLRRLAPRYAVMRFLAAVGSPAPQAAEIEELAEALPLRGPPNAPFDQVWEQLWPVGKDRAEQTLCAAWRGDSLTSRGLPDRGVLAPPFG
mmetsp:Transcript_15655/g.46998  ORF Transcript_15655/g.46998 Transcript_15655/m.46998 type:complete len:133 (+) Transcript_15655:183-581(+)